MSRRRGTLVVVAALLTSVLSPARIDAAGISVDAGLTPSEGRWILRTQLHYMSRQNDPTPMGREMETYVLRTSLAYGLRRNLTVMAAQSVNRREAFMAGAISEDTGLTDLMLMAKYGMYRRNTPEHTVGVSATLGVQFPTGASAFTSDAWGLKPGLYASWRNGRWAADASVTYKWNGTAVAGDVDTDLGDRLSVDCALARQFSVGYDARVVVAPVLELSYGRSFPDRSLGGDVPDTGESDLTLSPGGKLTISSFVLEGLVRIPVWQEQEGSQLEKGTGALAAVRFMF